MLETLDETAAGFVTVARQAQRVSQARSIPWAAETPSAPPQNIA
jgi:hypothetical protein